MKATSTRLKNATTEIEVTFASEEWQTAQEQALQTLAKNVNIHGFRPGKAPKALVKSKVSQASVYEKAMDSLLQKQYMEILSSAKVTPIAQPSVSIDKVNAEELVVKIAVPVEPEVTLGKYKGLEVTKKEAAVTEADIEHALHDYQQQFAELSNKEDGVVESGDTTIIDFKGFVDGEAFEGGAGENYTLEIGSGSFIPGFEEQVVGMKVAEQKDITVTFPSEYQQTDLAGKEAVFQVKLHEIKRKTLPAIDDELAKDVNIDGVETLEQLKTHIQEKLQANKESEVERSFQEDVFKALIENSQVEDSEALVQEECNIMMQEMEQNLQKQGLNFEMYEQFTGQSKDALLETMKPQAIDRVKLNVILRAIIKEEKLEASNEDVENEIKEIASYYEKDVEEIRKVFAKNMDRIEHDLLSRKALTLVMDNVSK